MARLEDFAPRSNFPYLFGTYLAVNAVPDAHLFVDGPDCAFYKAQFIQGKHDLQSTLIDCAGNHRIRFSDVTVNQVIGDRTAGLTEALRTMDSAPTCRVMLLTSMPMATITGTQYDLLVRALGEELSRPLLELPSRSLSGDWLDGYADTMEVLARGLELTGRPGVEGKVAVVGYFLDRNEQDHLANVAELERLLGGLGLEVVSVWFSGRPVEHLARVGEAGTIISLPHGRAAARILAERTGGRLVETHLPFGFKGTATWLHEIAVQVGAEARADALVARELRRCVPRIQWLISRYFFNAGVLFVGDPHLLEPLYDFLRELGCRVVGLVAVSGEHHLEEPPAGVAAAGVPLLHEANPHELEVLVGSLGSSESLDLAIQSDTFGWHRRGRCAVMPFGCACPSWHAIHDAPFLGFQGALSFVDRMAHRLMDRGRR